MLLHVASKVAIGRRLARKALAQTCSSKAHPQAATRCGGPQHVALVQVEDEVSPAHKGQHVCPVNDQVEAEAKAARGGKVLQLEGLSDAR